MQQRYEFDEVAFLSAVAVGQPGKRTFFLAIGKKDGWVRVWLEKQDLQALAMAIRQLLSAASKGRGRVMGPAETTEAVPSGLPSAELEVEEISIGYDDKGATLECAVRAMGPKRDDSAVVRCRTTLARLRQFGERAEGVCAAGRPICPLCGGPIDPGGHSCPSRN